MIRGIVLGIGQGFQPVAGYNYGAKKYRRVKKAFVVATLLGSAVSVMGAIFMAAFPVEIMEIFRDGDAEVIETGTKMLRFLAIALPFLGYSSYVNMMYQSLGFVKGATFLASCRQGVFFIPIILILPYFLGLDGVLMSQAVADIFTFLISIPFCVVFIRKNLSKD